MIDREKGIRGLEYCITHYNCRNLRAPDCPYFDLCKPIQNATGNTLMRDALSLLKEQEPVEIEIEGGGSTWWYVCEECHGAVDRGDKYCRHCGRPFRQDNNGGCNGCAYKGSEDCPKELFPDGNFYCPNGRLI